MSRLASCCLGALLLWTSTVAAYAASPAIESGSFLVLCYHEIPDDLREWPDPYAVEANELASQFAWLREHGYRPVGLSDIIAARSGGPRLPDKAVLLTFDDGYRSFYTRAYPLLRLYGYPAVVALVGRWMEAEPNDLVDYGGRLVPRGTFLSWDEVREMTGSGLVEVVSHSYDLHRGIPANPQGNVEPAATTRSYDPNTRSYENDDAYVARIRADLERSARLIERELGRRPRALVWPFGSHNRTVVQIAADLGMPVTFSLEDGWMSPRNPLDTVRRTLVRWNPTLTDFVDELEPQRHLPQRVVHVDLDYVYSEDAAEQERNLSALLDRIKALGASTVYLQAFADPDGDGVADALYFPNRHLPVREDLFNRVAWQLHTRTHVQVFAWMPLLAFRLPEGHPAAGLTVRTEDPERAPGTYARLSPFHPRARSVILEIYEDLARHAAFQGVLFHDDAMLTDFEDAAPWAIEVYARDWGMPASLDSIRRDPHLARDWARRKTEALVALTHDALDRARAYRYPLKSARNLYAAPVLDPAAEAWFAQSLPAFLEAYDTTALMAMPHLEAASDPQQWLDNLVERAKIQPDALQKIVFELQATDWRAPRPVDSEEIASAMRRLQLRGALNFGYYPDDFVRNHPELASVKRALSLTADLE